MTTEIGHGLGRGARKQSSSPLVEAEKARKTLKMRNSEEYQTMLKKNIDWLTQLDATDSNPGNGRLDISVFNAKVSKYGYEANEESEYPDWRHGVPVKKQDVDINIQATLMTDKYYAKKFGL